MADALIEQARKTVVEYITYSGALNAALIDLNSANSQKDAKIGRAHV